MGLWFFEAKHVLVRIWRMGWGNAAASWIVAWGLKLVWRLIIFMPAFVLPWAFCLISLVLSLSQLRLVTCTVVDALVTQLWIFAPHHRLWRVRLTRSLKEWEIRIRLMQSRESLKWYTGLSVLCCAALWAWSFDYSKLSSSCLLGKPCIIKARNHTYWLSYTSCVKRIDACSRKDCWHQDGCSGRISRGLESTTFFDIMCYGKSSSY